MYNQSTIHTKPRKKQIQSTKTKLFPQQINIHGQERRVFLMRHVNTNIHQQNKLIELQRIQQRPEENSQQSLIRLEDYQQLIRQQFSNSCSNSSASYQCQETRYKRGKPSQNLNDKWLRRKQESKKYEDNSKYSQKKINEKKKQEKRKMENRKLLLETSQEQKDTGKQSINHFDDRFFDLENYRQNICVSNQKGDEKDTVRVDFNDKIDTQLNQIAYFTHSHTQAQNDNQNNFAVTYQFSTVTDNIQPNVNNAVNTLENSNDYQHTSCLNTIDNHINLTHSVFYSNQNICNQPLKNEQNSPYEYQLLTALFDLPYRVSLDLFKTNTPNQQSIANTQSHHTSNLSNLSQPILIKKVIEQINNFFTIHEDQPLDILQQILSNKLFNNEQKQPTSKEQFNSTMKINLLVDTLRQFHKKIIEDLIKQTSKIFTANKNDRKQDNLTSQKMINLINPNNINIRFKQLQQQMNYNFRESLHSLKLTGSTLSSFACLQKHNKNIDILKNLNPIQSHIHNMIVRCFSDQILYDKYFQYYQYDRLLENQLTACMWLNQAGFCSNTVSNQSCQTQNKQKENLTFNQLLDKVQKAQLILQQQLMLIYYDLQQQQYKPFYQYIDIRSSSYSTTEWKIKREYQYWNRKNDKIQLLSNDDDELLHENKSCSLRLKDQIRWIENVEKLIDREQKQMEGKGKKMSELGKSMMRDEWVDQFDNCVNLIANKDKDEQVRLQQHQALILKEFLSTIENNVQHLVSMLSLLQ